MRTVRILSVLSLLLAATRLAAQTLTSVPMQGSMVHVGIEYHAEHSHLHVHVDPGVPELVALSQMDETSDFDPADPWHAALGRSGTGLAFNRQYGFVIGTESDPLPPGTGVWIRQLTATPNLEVYRYRATDPKAWEPMFGTAGSSDRLEWNLIMFHPAYAAPVGSGPHEAGYEAFLVNLADGSPVAAVDPTPFTLSWTVRGGAVEPTLDIALTVAVSWPATPEAYRIQVADAPEGPWMDVHREPVLIEGRLTLLVPPAMGQRFFRLQPVEQP